MKVLLLGATGLVGQEVLSRLLDHPQVSAVVAPVRRPLQREHSCLMSPVVDFAQLEQGGERWHVDAVICALGTTLKAAGSRDSFRWVDLELPLWFARQARAGGAQRFSLNSALGASPHSRFFYSRVKGELEDALGGLDFNSLTIVRPGLIDGQRLEVRRGERLGLGLAASCLLRPLLPRQWRPSPVSRIAQALVDGAVLAPVGRHLVEARDLA